MFARQVDIGKGRPANVEKHVSWIPISPNVCTRGWFQWACFMSVNINLCFSALPANGREAGPAHTARFALQ